MMDDGSIISSFETTSPEVEESSEAGHQNISEDGLEQTLIPMQVEIPTESFMQIANPSDEKIDVFKSEPQDVSEIESLEQFVTVGSETHDELPDANTLETMLKTEITDNVTSDGLESETEAVPQQFIIITRTAEDGTTSTGMKIHLICTLIIVRRQKTLSCSVFTFTSVVYLDVWTG